jgi:hypothetical protein
VKNANKNLLANCTAKELLNLEKGNPLLLEGINNELEEIKALWTGID